MRSSSRSSKGLKIRYNPVNRYNGNSYKNQFSRTTSRQARDTATFSVQEVYEQPDMWVGYLQGWQTLCRSESFGAIYRMFEQVSLQGMTVQFSITNVTPSSPQYNTQGSVQFLYAWDRDGVFQDKNFQGTGEDVQVKATTILGRSSAAMYDNVGVIGGTRTLNLQMWARSMQEKTLFISTDVLANALDDQVGGMFDNAIMTKISSWNPSLIFTLQKGYHASVRAIIRYHVVCRGVRILKAPSARDNLPLDIQNATCPIVKRFIYHRDANGNRVGQPATMFIAPALDFIGTHITVIKQQLGQANIFEGTTLTGTEIITASAMNTLTLEQQMATEESAKYVRVQEKNDTFPGEQEVSRLLYYDVLFYVTEDKFYDESKTKLPVAEIVQIPGKGQNRIGQQQVYYHMEGNNAYFSQDRPNLMGIVSYEEESRQLETQAMRVDGSKCYSAEKGGIYAEGYIDLNGPDLVNDDNVDGSTNACVAFTRIGDVSVGSEENNNALLEYNIANTGPQFEEVDQAANPMLLPGSYEFSDAGTFTFGTDSSEPGYQIIMDDAIRAGLSGICIEIRATVTSPRFASPINFIKLIGSSTNPLVLRWNYTIEIPALDAPEQDASISCRVESLVDDPYALTDSQIVSLFRLSMSDDSIGLLIPYNDVGIEVVTVYTTVQMGNLIQLPNQASKFWKRIKGFFQSAWKAIKNIVPKVAKVVSPVLPPPYGTVVAGVGAGVTAVDNVINTIASAAVKSTDYMSGIVSIDEEDVFRITPQFKFEPLTADVSNAADITTSPDSEWESGQTYDVKVNSVVNNTFHSSMKISDYPFLAKAIQTYRENLLQNGGSGETPSLALQQRAKVEFFKPCTEAQAQNYMTTLRLGTTQSLAYGEEQDGEVVNGMDLSGLNSLLSQDFPTGEFYK